MIYVTSPNIPWLDRSRLPARQRTTEHLLSVVQYHSIRYIIKSCPVTGGGRNAISEWTTITSRVIEPGQREPMCKSNIGCCDTYAHTLYYTVYLRSSIRELSWTIQYAAEILKDPHSTRKKSLVRVSYFLGIIAVKITAAVILNVSFAPRVFQAAVKIRG